MSEETQSKRKPYVRPIKKNWWVHHHFYLHYMLREGTCVFVGIYAVTLMWGLLRLSQGQAAFEGWVHAMTNPLVLLFHLVALVACLFHAFTWFQLAPKAIRILRGEELLPAKPIIMAQYIALAVVTVVVLLFAILAS